MPTFSASDEIHSEYCSEVLHEEKTGNVTEASLNVAGQVKRLLSPVRLVHDSELNDSPIVIMHTPRTYSGHRKVRSWEPCDENNPHTFALLHTTLLPTLPNTQRDRKNDKHGLRSEMGLKLPLKLNRKAVTTRFIMSSESTVREGR